eukprot:Sspe_Gene.22856::Locus_8768_Transcript_1_1_Confidence_1.000_Length_820::g.22856::m.22856
MEGYERGCPEKAALERWMQQQGRQFDDDDDVDCSDCDRVTLLKAGLMLATACALMIAYSADVDLVVEESTVTLPLRPPPADSVSRYTTEVLTASHGLSVPLPRGDRTCTCPLHERWTQSDTLNLRVAHSDEELEVIVRGHVGLAGIVQPVLKFPDGAVVSAPPPPAAWEISDDACRWWRGEETPWEVTVSGCDVTFRHVSKVSRGVPDVYAIQHLALALPQQGPWRPTPYRSTAVQYIIFKDKTQAATPDLEEQCA